MGLQHDSKRTSSTLELVHYWYEPYHKFGLIYLLVWDFICMAFNSHLFFALLNGEFTFPKNIFTAFFFFVLILAPTYWMLLFFINRTKIKMSRTKTIVQSGPLPSLRKNYSFSIRSILYVQVEEHCNNYNFENAWQGKTDETSNIRAILKNGDSIKILEDIQHKADAQIVRGRINSWLLETKRGELHQERIKDIV